jgi:Zn finger protein HypA/HybF involved in hydrogenase expression
MGAKTSIIWKMPKNEFEEIIKKHISYTDILKEFCFGGTGGPYRTLKKRLKEENIDCSHIGSTTKGREFPSKSISLEKIMIKNSTYSRGHLKKRLLNDGILENKCFICGQLPEHNNIELVMVLDHINGINDDHRLDNLRMLCPNCNSQQETFAGRNGRKKYYCKKCNEEIKKYSKFELCNNCVNIKKRKVKNRPSKETLLQDIKLLGYCKTGKKYGVSDNAIRKWLK